MANPHSNAPSGRKTGPPADEVSGENPTRCAGCPAIYPAALWTSLAFVRQIDAAEVARLVLDWPTGMAIEVRRCAKCGAALARKRKVSWCG
jgi:hypothetical protein